MSATDIARVKNSFERINETHRKTDSKIFISIANQEQALGNVQDSRPLSGLTFAAKDNIDVQGLSTTAACPSWSKTPSENATVVSRLIEAGASCMGKTNMDQFATGLVGTRSPYGTPTNALDPALVPGGSSSGSAVAVARGLVDFALGTDTAGSGRVPAAHNGIVGLKPTRGLISTTGVLPAVRSIDCVSIFARTIAEAWKVFEHARGVDPTDPFTRAGATTACSFPVRRIGIPDTLEFDSNVDRKAWLAALDKLSDVELIEIDISRLQEAAALLYDGPWVAERYAAVGEFLETGPADADPVVSAIISRGKDISAVEAYRGNYQLAAIQTACAELWNTIDILLVPSVPGLATLEEVAADPVGRNSRLGTYTNWVNLLDQCALTVPTVKRDDNLPGSITFIGPAGADALIAATAAQYFETPLQIAEDAANAGFLDIAVVGAHLTGQPLNWQLTQPGGKFLRTTQTSEGYKLYAIANSAIPKPALVDSGSGAAIEVEVWRLPFAAVGELLAQIPSPLGLGTLTLIDGTSVKGFIAEPKAVDGATDITGFGGWRAYRASL